MAQQPGGELASADAATRTPDAGVQERRIGAKISLRARRHSEYLLRPTPPHLSENAPGLQSGGDDHVARSRCCMMNQADGFFMRSGQQCDNARGAYSQNFIEPRRRA